MSQSFTYGVPVIIFYFGGKANLGTLYKYISCIYIYIYIVIYIYIYIYIFPMLRCLLLYLLCFVYTFFL